MKRSAPLQRRTELARSAKPMKRTELQRGKPLERGGPLKASTKRIRPSRPRAEERARRDRVRAEVFERDERTCRLAGVRGAGRCFGPLTFHHRLKAGQGGTYTVRNGAALCAHHNDELEASADLAAIGRRLGLVLTKREALLERFWSLCEEGPLPEWNPELGPCLLYGGTKTKDSGYGKFQPRSGEFVYAHRFALSTVEELVAGMEVDHLCRVRACCRISHLEQVTPAENKRRQALAQPERTRCGRGHPLEGRQAHGKLCLVCRREWQQQYNEARRAKSAAQRTEGQPRNDERLRTDSEGRTRARAAHEAPGPQAPAASRGSQDGQPRPGRTPARHGG